MRPIKIAVVFTCFNRKNHTENCLRKIYSQSCNDFGELDLRVFVCDDASTDGTVDMIRDCFPGATVVHGTGDLFWARGMYTALIEAEKYQPDFYLMINDDVDFSEDMITTLLSCYKYQNQLCAIVGATNSKIDGSFTYGGISWNHKIFREQQIPVKPSFPLAECDQANWNCFLLPAEIYNIVGRVDNHYEHSWADFDYSNRIRAEGFKIYVTSKYIGTCERNAPTGTWRDSKLPISVRWKLLHKKTGIPVRSNFRYCRRWYGVFWPCRFLKPYMQIIKSAWRR